MSKRKLLILFFCASCLCIMSQSRRTTTHKSTTRTQTAARKPQPQPTSGKLTERSFTFKAFEATGYFYTSYGNERFNVKSTFKFYYPIKCTDASVNTSMITQVVLKACFNADIEPTEQAMRQYAKTHAAWGDNFTPYTTTPKNIRITDTQFMGVRLASVYDDVLFFECSSEDFISGGQGLHGSYYIAVDAYTGQVLNASSFFSPDRQREIMSLLANTGVKYACSKYSSSDVAEIKSSLGYKARSSSLYFPTFYIKGNTLYLKFGVEELGWRSIGAPVFAIPLSMAKIDMRKPKPAAPSRQTTQSNAGQRTAPARGTTSQPKSALERMANQPSGQADTGSQSSATLKVGVKVKTAIAAGYKVWIGISNGVSGGTWYIYIIDKDGKKWPTDIEYHWCASPSYGGLTKAGAAALKKYVDTYGDYGENPVEDGLVWKSVKTDYFLPNAVIIAEDEDYY